MPITYLDPAHHVVRYVPWARLRKDEDNNVIGVLGAAFKLRDDEEYLSTTWAEFFQGPTHDDRVASAIRTIRASKLKVTALSGFAIGNVMHIRDACLADKQKLKIRFVHEAEPDNPAHAALRGWPRENDTLFDLLAEETWSTTVLNKDVP